MNGSQRSLSKRAFLASVGTACVAGCLGSSNGSSENGNSTDNSTDTNSTDSDSEPEPEPKEPTLFLVGDPRDELWDRGESWQDCESLDEWEVLSGSLEPATDNTYRGSQSAHLTSAGDGEVRVRIPLEGYDLTETTFSLAMYIDSPGNHYSPSFDVNAPESGRELHFRTRHKIDEPGWIRYDLGVSLTSALAGEESYMTISWGGSDVDWYIDDIRAVSVERDPKLFVQFDDSLRTTYDTAFPIMEEYGITATNFAITGREGADRHLTLSQMEEMQEAGWEFGSHTHTHRRTGELSLDEQREELEKSKEWLLDHGFTQAASTFAYPFGSFTTGTMDLAADYYDFATHGQRGAMNRLVSSPLSVNRHPADNAEQSMALIDLLLDERIPTDTLVLYYHDVIEDHDLWINPEDFEETMAYIDERNVDCRLTSELRAHQFG
ncbi:MAG: polysaccharide deacetylase family protein [Euryarchaeota archaeon]|nr:polysaccharide deacetylase family protein [Euryarchaeota archaeon]